MADDGSIASQVESWAVSTLKTADTGSVFKTIAQYDGVLNQGSGQRIAEEIVADRVPIALVLVDGAFTNEDNEQLPDRLYTLRVLAGIRNERGGVEARCGDGTKIGIHRAMELIADALERLNPGKSDPDNNRIATRCNVVSGNVLYEQSGLYVGEVEFKVRAVKKPS